VALLLPASGSDWSEWETDAVFVWGLGEVIVARSFRVCGVDVVTVPTVHTPLFEAYVPWLGVADTNDSPAGIRSVT
jgi:hypothetical protein